MAKKKAAIGELIKSDMSRRVIRDAAEEQSFDEDQKPPVKKSVAPPPAAIPRPTTPASQPNTLSKSEGSAGLTAFIADQAKSVGLTDESDLRTFYAFLQSQAIRYIRGFDAGRRFHG